MIAWAMLGAGAEVTVRRGRLTVRTLSPIPALYRGLRLHPDDPDDPYIFRIDLFPVRSGHGTHRVRPRRCRGNDSAALRRNPAVRGKEQGCSEPQDVGRAERLVGLLLPPP